MGALPCSDLGQKSQDIAQRIPKGLYIGPYMGMLGSIPRVLGLQGADHLGGMIGDKVHAVFTIADIS